jgi:hypothetical protein
VAGWAVIMIIWTTPVSLQMDTLKAYKPFFQQAGRIAGNQTVIGYNLTETARAFCPFYGGFTTLNIEEKNAFKQMVVSNRAQYALFIPKKNDMDLRKILESRGQRLLVIDSEAKRPTEFWRLSRSAPAQKGP